MKEDVVLRCRGAGQHLFLCVLSIENLLYNLNFVMEIFFVF